MATNVDSIINEARRKLAAESKTPPAIPPGVAEKLDERQRRFNELADGFGHVNTEPRNRVPR